jgi:hypothetical protein
MSMLLQLRRTAMLESGTPSKLNNAEIAAAAVVLTEGADPVNPINDGLF